MLYYEVQFKKFSAGFSKHMPLASLLMGDFSSQMEETQDAYYFNTPKK